MKTIKPEVGNTLYCKYNIASNMLAEVTWILTDDAHVLQCKWLIKGYKVLKGSW
jgi:hypothetical protein